MGAVAAQLEGEIREFRKAIATKIPVDLLLVFGSHARGDARPDSDLDVIIVSPAFRGLDLVERHRMVRPMWVMGRDIDIIPYTPEEFATLKDRVSIVSVALGEGVEVL